jgi:regulator of sigma E protease
MVSGKKPSDKFLERAQMVGFVLLITLLVFANGNDIYKAIVGK